MMVMFNVKSLSIHKYIDIHSKKTNRFEVLAKMFICDKIKIQDERVFYKIINEKKEDENFLREQINYDFTKVYFSYCEESFFINKKIEAV